MTNYEKCDKVYNYIMENFSGYSLIKHMIQWLDTDTLYKCLCDFCIDNDLDIDEILED